MIIDSDFKGRLKESDKAKSSYIAIVIASYPADWDWKSEIGNVSKRSPHPLGHNKVPSRGHKTPWSCSAFGSLPVALKGRWGSARGCKGLDEDMKSVPWETTLALPQEMCNWRSDLTTNPQIWLLTRVKSMFIPSYCRGLHRCRWPDKSRHIIWSSGALAVTCLCSVWSC